MSNAAQPNVQTLAALQRLIEVVAQLRSPDGGCPWDLAQTPQTLIPYVIEEAYEVVDAIRQGNSEAIADELGDLLLQVVLQAQIASETQQFDLTDIANGITEKLIRRHPHVFGDVQVQSAEEVHQNWEKIKAAEEQAKPDQAATSEASLVPRLSRYARSLPPLMAGMKISQKAAAAGFEWEDVDGVWAKFREELEEFHQALASEPKEHQQAELGDVLFTLINIARWYDLDPAEALQSTNQRFINRLAHVEAVADRPLSTYSLEELEELWQYAKAQLRQGIG
ncbi:nucleoside triphosphate pyrophosphohydrolase [Oscillatoria sp. FACHB-1407]|uniref:nucleoside triphosphate pyrophosphohydrolase n=1 Tax=Oscillatoria sp. FACHB-1407 TaxID=2692847 RepID=UPI00168814E5|nr:nucleoside triphosphate pyrophosphohydrolase [Oscillatoria sp. FACHB-1407]MBD2464857.1 nucleoside triphosphate pyrophosphohydrolase [Oscillatoria sp. FACHB-1407]